MINVIKFSCEDYQVSFYLVYCTFALLGVCYHPFFFSVLVFDLIIANETLQHVLSALVIPYSELLLTIILLYVFMYVFSFIAFLWFQPDFDPDKGSDTIYPSDLKCDSILNCFLIIIDKCFKYDGGIGGYLAAINEHKEMKIDYPIVYKRIVFDALFYILLLIVLVNIISGIIIDTFSVLRIKKAIYINDLRDVCFICGYGKEEIDMVSEKDGFRHHIKKEHYQWNYLFYIGYLRDKPDTEFTGLESYVYEMIQNNDISWMPCHQAIVILGTS